MLLLGCYLSDNQDVIKHPNITCIPFPAHNHFVIKHCGTTLKRGIPRVFFEYMNRAMPNALTHTTMIIAWRALP